MALDRRYCLHASAAKLGDRVIALCGDSGAGKSTIALELERLAGSGWARVADDILPIGRVDEQIVALPHFPQLKLPPESQPGALQPEQLALSAVFILEAPEEQDHASDSLQLPTAEIDRLGTKDGMLALVGHTVASRLFDSQLTAEHLHFCAEAAAAIPVARLSYPRQLRATHIVSAAIAEFLSDQA
jgi:hypothetical protein